MHVVIAGASGFLGRHLAEELGRRGHTVTALVRRPASGPTESAWDPYSGTYAPAVVESADVVVNLAGSPTLGNPHSGAWARSLRESRVTTTRVLARAVASSDRKPALLAGNAVGWYGDHGTAVLTEAADSRGHSFMTRVCREWQAAVDPAVEAGARVCVLRTAPVMDVRSAPLKQLRVLFRAGLGARLGDGRQFFPLVSLRDWVGAVAHVAGQDGISGPVNICCPQTPTNAEFTRALGRALHRPAVAAVPAPLLRLGAGRLAPEALGSLRLRPAALEAGGFEFRDRDVTDVLTAGLAAA